MKYILNKMPVRTTNKDNVNEFVIDTVLPSMNIDSLYKINTFYKKEITKFDSLIGLSFEKANFLEIDVTKDTFIECDIKDTLVDIITLNIKDKSTVNIIYKSDKKVDHHMKLIINGNSDSIINIINLTDTLSRSFLAIEANIYSNVVVNLIDLGGALRVCNYNAIVEKGISTFNNIYLTKNDTLDLNYYVKLKNPDVEGYINSKGILNGRSTKVYKGVIDFISGASKSIGKQEEHVIILSNDAINKSLPILLCGEEDVEGAHASSIGSIDKSKLFYLESRGLDKSEASKEIILGEFNSILDYLPIKEEIQSIIRKRL